MRISIALTMALCAAPAMAQSALDQDVLGLFEPLSRTAISITGPILISPSSIAFGGITVLTTPQGKYWRVWGDDSKKSAAKVYELKSDPGKLLQGNTLCGSNPARFAVVWPSYDELIGGSVKLAIYSSSDAPYDSSSPGLCGIFNYVLKRPKVK